MNVTNAWWIFAIVSGAGLAGRNVLFKVANTRLDAAFAAMILSVSMAAVSILFMLGQRASSDQAFIPSQISWQGVSIAALAGASLAAANIFLAFSYRAGGAASVVSVLQNGVSIGLTLLIGLLFLQEIVKPVQFLGIALAGAGIFLMTRR